MENYLDRFADVICASDEVAIRSDVTLAGKLVIATAGILTVSYAPFEHIVATAKLVIVGITPGEQQAANALCEVRRRLRAGDDHSSALAAAKVYASFSGPMRKNLVDMLDHIGLARWLGMPSTEALWTTHCALAHFTSALRYPVFCNRVNSNGDVERINFNRRVDRPELLRRMLDQCLAVEAVALPDALWVPLGPKVEEGLQYLVHKNLLRSEAVLSGLPHPSPANSERVLYFLGRKPRETLSDKTKPAVIDTARARLMAKVASLMSGS